MIIFIIHSHYMHICRTFVYAFMYTDIHTFLIHTSIHACIYESIIIPVDRKSDMEIGVLSREVGGHASSRIIFSILLHILCEQQFWESDAVISFRGLHLDTAKCPYWIRTAPKTKVHNLQICGYGK